ncbi:sulfite exporter TauE/SafE family protein, partial [Nostoc sp. NIES-2111]
MAVIELTQEPLRRPGLAFVAGAVIGVLGGLIGLGGAEFRLPVLIAFFALAAHQAVRINLLVSLVTLAASAVARFGFADFPDLGNYAGEIIAVAAGSIAAAWFGAGLLSRISPAKLMLLIAVLLFAIGGLLGFEAAIGDRTTGALVETLPLRIVTGIAAGIGIGLVSSLLGVAGGELIIPTMLFVFGLDIRTAGTASLLISIPTVLVGVLRHYISGAYRSRQSLLALVIPMAGGSVVGAIIGAALLPLVPAGSIKIALA